ncbi:MAG: hypothetical protein JOZ72_08265 [Alphaproteobacteria bacterium]|nr:hypothetical protein [Alphaproteobacteria bacterium]
MRLLPSISFGFSLLAAVGLASPALAGEHVLYSFDARVPFGDLVLAKSGTLYGAVSFGGAHGLGQLYSFDRDGNYTVLHDFAGKGDGAYPNGGLIADADGNLYGVTQRGGGAFNMGEVFKRAPDGTMTVLHAFKGGSEGMYPIGRLLRDKHGNLYGTTYTSYIGGPFGTVYKIAPDGTFSVLHAFHGNDGDGVSPVGGLAMDRSGNLYGLTVHGGASDYGALYKIDTSGRESVLASFAYADSFPSDAPVVDDAGNVYGVTNNGVGTVFKVTPDGIRSTLHTFDPNKDGQKPVGTPMLDTAGNLYGTAIGGGHHCEQQGFGCGTVYKLAPDGKMTVLHYFDGGNDGYVPYGGLAMNNHGTLFGVTKAGGASSDGTIFAIKP